jgi:CubicO group peptidase (beta-lactamase class C family)
MTHTTGLACDDNQDDSPGNEGAMQQQTAQPDWWRYTLNLPMSFEPGTHYLLLGDHEPGGRGAYHSHPHLAAGILRSYRRPAAPVRPVLFQPPAHLEGYLGGGLQVRPRDLLKIGQVYVAGGLWNGRRIVSADWVRRSTMQQVADTAQSRDGFAWHRGVVTSGGRSFREYEANGNGGQFVIVLPELDLVVTFTAGNYQAYGVWAASATIW